MRGRLLITLLGGLVSLAGCTALPAAPPPTAQASPPVEAEPGYDPAAGPRPLAVLVVTNPWAGLMGADIPRFALYDDRTVVYPHDLGDGSSEYHTVTLPPEAFRQLAARLALTPEFLGLKPHYRAVPMTDQPTSVLFLSDGVTSHAVSIYGLFPGGWRGPATLTRWPTEPVPPEAERLFQVMAEFDHPDGTPWAPPFVEVIMVKTPGKASRRWTSGFPGLHHPSTRKWPDGHTYSIYLSKNQWDQLTGRAAGKPRKPDKIYRIDGKSMKIRWTRPVFFGEPLWQGAVVAPGHR
jgi:hypothetical protein